MGAFIFDRNRRHGLWSYERFWHNVTRGYKKPMILTLFGVLVGIALVLVSIGIFKPEESALAIIGFVLLFLLGVVIINGTLEYETGSIVNSTYTYSGSIVTKTDQVITNQYDYFNDNTSKQVGYYLSIVSFVSFIGVIIALRRSKKNE